MLKGNTIRIAIVEDDEDDFIILLLLYQEHKMINHYIKITILYIDKYKVFLDKMKNNINKYSK